MKTKKQRTSIFLVLVPHRDARSSLLKDSLNMFKDGFSGVCQFPFVVPAALLSKSLTVDELKHCACAYRTAIGREKINAEQGAFVEFSEMLSLFGLRLENSLPQNIFNESAALKIKKLISPHIIGSLLFEKTNTPSPQSLPKENALSFRAAAFANMYWKSMQIKGDGAFGFKWKIGKLFWLPSV